jgi:hypothetical protein
MKCETPLKDDKTILEAIQAAQDELALARAFEFSVHPGILPQGFEQPWVPIADLEALSEQSSSEREQRLELAVAGGMAAEQNQAVDPPAIRIQEGLDLPYGPQGVFRIGAETGDEVSPFLQVYH